MANAWKAWCFEELQMLERNAGKISISELAQQLGRSKSSVQYCALRHGLSLRIRTEDEHDAWLCRELYKEGLTIAVIAEKMEMSRNQVFNIVYRSN
jgi:DNA-binding IclR family transcriptional regulator